MDSQNPIISALAPAPGGRDPLRYDRLAEAFLTQECAAGRCPLHHAGRYYVYDGTRYVPHAELELDIRRFLRANNLGQSNATVGNVAPVVRSRVNKSAAKYPALPFYTGPDPFPTGRVVAFANGLLAVEGYLAGSPRLLPHTPYWVSTVCLPFAFDPAAECPEWLRFLAEVFEADADRVALLQEWCGYCLAPDTSKHKLMMFVGVPRAGKGTIMRLLENLVVAYFRCTPGSASHSDNVHT